MFYVLRVRVTLSSSLWLRRRIPDSFRGILRNSPELRERRGFRRSARAWRAPAPWRFWTAPYESAKAKITTAFPAASARRRQAVLHGPLCEGRKAVEGYRAPSRSASGDVIRAIPGTSLRSEQSIHFLPSGDVITTPASPHARSRPLVHSMRRR